MIPGVAKQRIRSIFVWCTQTRGWQRPKISAFAPIFHKLSLGKRKVEFGTGPVVVVVENKRSPEQQQVLNV